MYYYCCLTGLHLHVNRLQVRRFPFAACIITENPRDMEIKQCKYVSELVHSSAVMLLHACHGLFSKGDHDARSPGCNIHRIHPIDRRFLRLFTCQLGILGSNAEAKGSKLWFERVDFNPKAAILKLLIELPSCGQPDTSDTSQKLRRDAPDSIRDDKCGTVTRLQSRRIKTTLRALLRNMVLYEISICHECLLQWNYFNRAQRLPEIFEYPNQILQQPRSPMSTQWRLLLIEVLHRAAFDHVKEAGQILVSKWRLAELTLMNTAAPSGLYSILLSPSKLEATHCSDDGCQNAIVLPSFHVDKEINYIGSDLSGVGSSFRAQSAQQCLHVCTTFERVPSFPRCSSMTFYDDTKSSQQPNCYLKSAANPRKEKGKGLESIRLVNICYLELLNERPLARPLNEGPLACWSSRQGDLVSVSSICANNFANKSLGLLDDEATADWEEFRTEVVEVSFRDAMAKVSYETEDLEATKSEIDFTLEAALHTLSEVRHSYLANMAEIWRRLSTREAWERAAYLIWFTVGRWREQAGAAVLQSQQLTLIAVVFMPPLAVFCVLALMLLAFTRTPRQY